MAKKKKNNLYGGGLWQIRLGFWSIKTNNIFIIGNKEISFKHNR